MKNLLVFLILIAFILTASSANLAKSDKNKSKKNIKYNEQEFKPSVDGFLGQANGTFNSELSYAELKRMTGYAREVYVSFDLSDMLISAKSATLKFFCQSFDKYSEPTISVYCLPGFQSAGLTWATRPTFPTAIASLSVNQIEHTNTWLEWNISSLLPSLLAMQNKQVTFVIVVTEGNDALVKLAMSESASNSPSILLSDEDPINGGTNSTIKMPTLFSDNMVLQRDKPIKVWGEVLPYEPVSVTFDGLTYITQCDASGKFSTLIPAKSASASAYTMTIAANKETLNYKNIVLGDVYLCGGQSNMAMYTGSSTVDQVANAKADSNYPDLRFFEVAKIVSGGVLINAKDNPWKSAIPERVVNWSAVAFFVGRDLHKHLNIPIGLINVSHGGAPSDAFISPEAYASDPVLTAAKRPDGTGIYQYYTTPSSLYTSMISKVAGYPLKGVLWYQAEANTGYWKNYKTIFKGLIKDWRTKWNEPTLPWLFVQLPGMESSAVNTWAETRDIQLQVWKEDPNTGMAVTIDLGEATNIHPTDKYTVAKRLLPHVKALVYGEQISHRSPIYKSHDVQGADLTVTFENVGSGLTAKKEITEFEIAGADKVYKIASAILLPDNRIKLTNATVSNPVYVRYAFKNFPTVSIYTTDALPLPLSPFKTEYPEVLDTSNEISFDKINNAYASSTYPDRLPLYAINGAGLIGDGHDASAVTSKAWHTNDVVFPHNFKIELKAPQEIAGMRIWNLNWAATYLNRGVKDIEIYVSTSTTTMQNTAFSQPEWTKVMSYTMSKATGESTYKGELLTFPTNQKNVKWVGINILNSYNTANGYTGISEIKLYSPATSTQLFSVFDEKIKDAVESQLAVYPNPTSGILNIEKVREPKKIEVFDLIGNTLYQVNFANKIDLAFLSKGIYFVRTDLNQVAKVVVNLNSIKSRSL